MARGTGLTRLILSHAIFQAAQVVEPKITSGVAYFMMTLAGYNSFL